ncbi:MAG: cytochrome ubiquinol oxidase subunit I [Deltaproteobacteria bacterium]|nr:cytochrome ubiquinol oxidase subunit I [Deltaproteobacteria bacterium]MBW2255281.1 cytochrome ubiquinol oxidase subunit I [Deltaproteobacteria bacterium]
MTDLLAARSQMAMAFAFHIVFAVVGIGLPLLMVIAEASWLRTRRRVYLELARRWGKGTAILFVVGAVSGTVLSFELGLLWPEFMAFAGPIIGMPFSLEGFAFFLEAIFLGIYLYGWERVSPRAHLFAGCMVLLSGALSGVFVVTANAWMNQPAGFILVGDQLAYVDPFAAMLNPAAFSETLHMTLAAFATVGFAVAGLHAGMLLRDIENPFHRRAIGIALPVGAVFALALVASGDLSGKFVAEYQPAKLAAAEAHWETASAVPLLIGGWPDEEAEETRFAIRIPYLLSFIAHGDPHAEVVGLKDIPVDERPPVLPVHLAFQVMVGCGVALALTALLGGVLAVRRRGLPDSRWYLYLLACTSPLGFVAVEAGWVVTEVGRQPWVVWGLFRTEDAVTPMPGLVVPFAVLTALYLFLGVSVVFLMRRQVFMSPEADAFVEDGEATVDGA